MKIIYPKTIKNELNENNLEYSNYNILFLLYYYKWLSSKMKITILDKVYKNYIKYNRYKKYNYPYSLNNYTSKQKELIVQNVGFFQLSFGCTNGCNFCGCDAPYFKKPISIPFNQIKFLLKKYKNDFVRNYTFFYWASDPSDYSYGGKDYTSIVKLYKKYTGKIPFTSITLNNKNFSIFNKLRKTNVRVSKLGSNKTLFDKLDKKDQDKYYSNKEIMSNGLNGFLKKKYDFGILCLNGVLITPLGCYNLVNIKECNDYFPQGLLSYPIEYINNKSIIVGENLITYLNSKIVMYDYIQNRSKLGYFNNIVVFLRDYKKIYLVIANKNHINKGILKITFIKSISNDLYKELVFTKKGQNLLYDIEYNDKQF